MICIHGLILRSITQWTAFDKGILSIREYKQSVWNYQIMYKSVLVYSPVKIQQMHHKTTYPYKLKTRMQNANYKVSFYIHYTTSNTDDFFHLRKCYNIELRELVLHIVRLNYVHSLCMQIMNIHLERSSSRSGYTAH